MPSVKNKWVKPGGSFNYTEGQRVLNQSGGTYPLLTAVQITGVAGGVGVVTPASATDGASPGDNVAGRILFLRHAIPSGRYGVGTPWIIATGTTQSPLDTSLATIGDPVYIDKDSGAPLAPTGEWTLTLPGAAGETARVIGYVLVVDSIIGSISFANTNAL
tara:strand:+ start:296 stop:778 length:483 start_codon:yes stop_codon:yes gene_type:complete